MKLCVMSANLGEFEKDVSHEVQELPDGIEEIRYRTFTDADYLPRKNSMTPRLQARIVKTHMWQFEPGFDYYLWIDSSCSLSREGSVKWFMEQLGAADIAVFKHPHRNTIQEEADYLKERLKLESEGKKRKYILPRYENEDIDGQLKVVDPQQELYASTAFIINNGHYIKSAMEDWWYNISRYHSIDQLSLPHVLTNTGVKIKVIQENYLKCQYIKAVRK
jgi:hypothetical protein